MPSTGKIRTGTETLLACMEEFGTSEPKDLLVIYTNEAGELCWSCSTDSVTTKLGLLEACKQFMIQKLNREWT